MIDVWTTRREERGFLHKRIFKFAKRLVRPALGAVALTGIPGISQLAQLGKSFTRGGKRSRGFTDARAVQRARARRARRSLAPGLRPKGPGGIIGLLPGVKGGISGFAEDGAAGGAQCAKGFHVNKSTYHLKDGTTVLRGTRCVKNRRRNNDNGRAAMRAARRLLGRKKSQDQIDRALRAFAPRGRRKPAASGTGKGTTIVQN